MICDEQALTFYLGTHRPGWLLTAPREVALFISHRTLRKLVTLPRPDYRHYAVDSGAFTELQRYGQFRTGPREYIEALARYDEEIGDLAWAAPQDWMCEPAVIEGGTWAGQQFAGTGRSVAEHQALTVANFVELEALWPQYGYGECPVMPVIQGWTVDDYLRCVELYEEAGVRLSTDYPVVGVGSVCRRQGTAEIGTIFRELAALDLPLHGFGVKTAGLLRYGRWLTTADSMAWSAAMRRRPPAPQCAGYRKHCGNCMHAALSWQDDLLGRFTAAMDAPQQLDLIHDSDDLALC
ncbi:deazapurine DNA modification protein DpdA family protein [Actinomadura montaniterrae]|uniref:deazapurine DNA modification protein DpdA family protein n=1 Tax=Actinomadura montaniterrae TaxID=1803903 RepID=UPI001CEF94E7|nr:hypothetical protein [Actinomadura montaniterrae]